MRLEIDVDGTGKSVADDLWFTARHGTTFAVFSILNTTGTEPEVARAAFRLLD